MLEIHDHCIILTYKDDKVETKTVFRIRYTPSFLNGHGENDSGLDFT